MKLLKNISYDARYEKIQQSANQSSARDGMTYFNISVALKHHRGGGNHDNKEHNLGNFSKSHSSDNTGFPWITKKLTISTFHFLEPIIAIWNFCRKSSLKNTWKQKKLLFFWIFLKVCKKTEVRREYFEKIARLFETGHEFENLHRNTLKRIIEIWKSFGG